MTQAEIEQRIAELQAEIEELERQRSACPFKLPVYAKLINGRWRIVEKDTLTEICLLVNSQRDARHIVNAINAYPAYEPLREFWESFKGRSWHPAGNESERLWLAARDAIETVEKNP